MVSLPGLPLHDVGMRVNELQHRHVHLHSCSRIGRTARCMRPRRCQRTKSGSSGLLRAQNDDQQLSLVGNLVPCLQRCRAQQVGRFTVVSTQARFSMGCAQPSKA